MRRRCGEGGWGERAHACPLEAGERTGARGLGWYDPLGPPTGDCDGEHERALLVVDVAHADPFSVEQLRPSPVRSESLVIGAWTMSGTR